MSPRLTRLAAAMAGASLLSLAACGGGGSSGSTDPAAAATPTTPATPSTPATPTTPSTPASVQFSGVVATGAPLTGASVKVYDGTGAVVCDTTVDAAGGYQCDLGTSPKAPFVIVAQRDDMKLVSMFAEASSSTVNVTPLTHLVAAKLASNGDPAQLVDDVKGGAGNLDKAKLDTAVQAVVALIRPVIDALGETTNPLTGTFVANGTGHDKLLDALQISVRPTGTEANVEITVRTLPTADDSTPVGLSFKTSDTSVAPVTGVSASVLGTDNVAMQIADMLSRLAACYALPLADRVTNANNPGSTVKADACKTLFSGNDPANFLSNGAHVGPTGAFSGMFRAGGTGVSFDRGLFDFYRANGDVVFSYRWTDTAGNTDNDQMVARVEAGKLKLIGNQYAYEARVRAWVQNRELVNSPTFSHIDTGYNVSIANRVDGSGNPLFSKVLVTTPKGNVLTFKPAAGLSYLAGVNPAGVLSASSVIRLNGKYVDPATAGHPKDKEPALLYADTTAYPDDVIKQIPDQGVWKLEFFHVNPAVPNVIQQYRTTSRAPTLAEASAMSYAELTTTAKTELVADTAASGVKSWLTAPNGTTPNWARLATAAGGDFWRVPSGALEPVSASIYGRAPTVGGVLGARFNDSLGIPSSARTATVRCSRQSLSDAHCDASLTDQYAQGSNANSIELWARSPRQVEVSKMIGVYKVN